MKAARIIKIKHFLKIIANAILGIFSETALVFAFILAGFAVCVLWWSVFK